uniref:Reverse transcriptase Ty1/copia-type domain-containing protein n=1 Tax=Solanum lycopersicum TaxID=4081 RepID=A0A3Q7HKI0_SOLLC
MDHLIQERVFVNPMHVSDMLSDDLQYTIHVVSRCSPTNVSHESPTVTSFNEVDHSESPIVDNEVSQEPATLTNVRWSVRQKLKPTWMKDFVSFTVNKDVISAAGILMHQRKYALELIAEVGLTAAKPAGTPIYINVKLTSKLYDEHVNKEQEESNDPLVDQTTYQKIIGKLLYLNMTRLDISFSTQTLSQFLQQPKRSHLDAALRVIRYLKKQHGQGLLLASDSDGQVTAFCDADWASCEVCDRVYD